MYDSFALPQTDFRLAADGDASTITVRYLTALTPRERDVLLRLDEGHSTFEIGSLLNISENGVKFHLKNIFTKLGARRRTEAVRLARRYQLLGPDKAESTAHVRIVA